MVGDVVEVPLEVAVEDPDIMAEAHLEFREVREQTEGLCSCVCINDEQCCSCLVQ